MFYYLEIEWEGGENTFMFSNLEIGWEGGEDTFMFSNHEIGYEGGEDTFIVSYLEIGWEGGEDTFMNRKLLLLHLDSHIREGVLLPRVTKRKKHLIKREKIYFLLAFPGTVIFLIYSSIFCRGQSLHLLLSNYIFSLVKQIFSLFSIPQPPPIWKRLTIGIYLLSSV